MWEERLSPYSKAEVLVGGILDEIDDLVRVYLDQRLCQRTLFQK